MVGVESAVLIWGPRVQLSSCIVIYNFRAMPVSAISKYARPQGEVMRQCRLFDTRYQFQTPPAFGRACIVRMLQKWTPGPLVGGLSSYLVPRNSQSWSEGLDSSGCLQYNSCGYPRQIGICSINTCWTSPTSKAPLEPPPFSPLTTPGKGRTRSSFPEGSLSPFTNGHSIKCCDNGHTQNT